MNYSYRLFQVKNGVEYRDYRYVNWKDYQEIFNKRGVDLNKYDMVHKGTVEADGVEHALDTLYR